MKLLYIITVFALTTLISSTAYALCNVNIRITKPNSIYAVNGNGTVTDNETGLMWQQCSLGLSGATCATGSATPYNWKIALEAAQTANGGAGMFGYTDWRLPSIAELRTLSESACVDIAINTKVFPATVSDSYSYYWSASQYVGGIYYVWVVDFNEGHEEYRDKSNNGYVRLVRGGQ